MKNEVSNKMLFGMIITLIGLVFSAFSFIYTSTNAGVYNGIDGLLGSFLINDMLLPFIIGTIIMIAGLVLCYMEAYKK